jgi:Flp pilus assembly pilin Flp
MEYALIFVLVVIVVIIVVTFSAAISKQVYGSFKVFSDNSKLAPASESFRCGTLDDRADPCTLFHIDRNTHFLLRSPVLFNQVRPARIFQSV